MKDSTFKPDPELVSECKAVQAEYAADFNKYQRSPCGPGNKYGAGAMPSAETIKKGEGVD